MRLLERRLVAASPCSGLTLMAKRTAMRQWAMAIGNGMKVLPKMAQAVCVKFRLRT